MSSRYDVVVIGGGHNGLTAAALVAQRGRKTLLVERREVLGGLAAGEEFHPGFRDSGVLHETAHVRPSVVRALGLEKLGLVMSAADAPALAVEERGPGLLLSGDREVMFDELERRAAGDGDGYIGFRKFVNRVTPAIRRLMNEPPPDIFEPGVRDLFSLGLSAVALRRLGKTTMMELLRVAPTPVADFIDEWFDDELTKAALAAPAVWSTWTGPRSPGTTLNLLLAEATRARPVVGGPRALIEALEKAARDRGVEIRTDAPVEEVEVTDGVVRGVRAEGRREDPLSLGGRLL